VPNLFLLNCNHFADIAADILHGEMFQKSQPRCKIHIPSSKLRFYITRDEKAIDKSVSDAMKKILPKCTYNGIEEGGYVRPTLENHE